MQSSEPDYIIAIGASAGGLEEINTFFDHTPLDGVAYVIVQHLSSDFKSRMVELLAKHSKLMIREATEGMPVCTNVVYLIPNDKYMIIKDNHLHLLDKTKNKGPHLTINTFFNSLAADRGSKAIGVVLSGLGSDGTEGTIAIKEAGGMVIARNPESSEFSSMPAHAIATAMVDFVLDPEKMPQAIETYVKQQEAIVAENVVDEKTILLIMDYIKTKLPFDFTNYKTTTILRRTKRRAASINIHDLNQYFIFLKSNPKELADLANDFLISVTAFFRNTEAFDLLQKKVLPKLLEQLAPNEEIKCWIAGCATGEEAYSIAILLSELLAKNNSNHNVKIFATDIDSAALVYAGKGIYTAEKVQNISAGRLEHYFDKKGNDYVVKPIIRKMLIFAQHDLVKNPPYCNVHLISCRNLLIYMTPVLQKKVLAMMLFGLKTEGYLFLGSSENPLSILPNLEVIHKKWRIYKSLKNKREVALEAFVLPDMLDIKRPPSIANEATFIEMPNFITETLNETLAKELGYLITFTDQDNKVLKSYGDSSKYLLQQNFNSHIVELLPQPLAVAYNSLSKDALKKDHTVSAKGIRFKHNSKIMEISLTITPISTSSSKQKGLISIFRDDVESRATQNAVPQFDEVAYNTHYATRLEEEVRDLKLNLRSSYEKLEASNENMQSFNEELISTNEEMQSTNEEMQSVNEELHTINAEYQYKNKELIEINDDLNNYFRSNINGQLFLNKDLELMKFSPGAVKHINLVETDIGRPISHLSTNIKFDTILEDVKQVLAKDIVVSKEIETNTGSWYQIMIMPYIHSGKTTNGAIITFNDITELKNTQSELNKKNESLSRVNADMDHFIHTASHDLLAPLGNIEASIGMLSDPEITPTDFKDFLTIINASVKKFRTLITDISVIAKVESDSTKTETVHLEELLDEIEWSLRDQIKNANVQIIRKLKVKNVHFSKKNIRSILFNLVANAIKFRRDVPLVIIIQAIKEEGNFMISVSDNGRGIAPEARTKIFDMYGRLNQDIEGSGIGLYLAKKIITAASGTITVESELGKSTKFIIYLADEKAKK